MGQKNLGGLHDLTVVDAVEIADRGAGHRMDEAQLERGGIAQRQARDIGAGATGFGQAQPDATATRLSRKRSERQKGDGGQDRHPHAAQGSAQKHYWEMPFSS